MKTQDIKNIASAYKQVLEKKLDAVNPDELKGTHAQRKDKDIDNDGDVDSSDEYLHNRRKAIKTAMKKEEVEQLDELSPNTLKSYVKKANRSANKSFSNAIKQQTRARKGVAGADEKRAQHSRDFDKRSTGIERAKARLTKEEVELDEASQQNLDKAMSIINARITKPGQPPKHPSYHSAPEDIKTAAKNLAKNLAKNMKEEVELNEASVKKVMGMHQVIHKGKPVATYVAKYEADDHAKQINDEERRNRKGKKNESFDLSEMNKTHAKEDTDMTESRWPILQRIMERQNHGNMNNGSPRGEGLSPSAKAELARSEGDSGIDGAKAAADTIQNAAAGVKVAPKRRGDQTIGDKTMPKNDGK
jgi:hypothetical protein